MGKEEIGLFFAVSELVALLGYFSDVGLAAALIQSKEKALIVPIDTILEDPETGENSVVLLNGDNTVTIIPVKLGIEGTMNIEVISTKLKVKDKIILNPGFDLKNGMTVKIQEEAKTTNE